MYIYGSGIPLNSEVVKSIDTSHMNDVTHSGIFKILINTTSWKRLLGKNGGTWDNLKLFCVAYSLKDELIGKLNFDLPLNSNKAHQLSYFLSFINNDGDFYLPSPRRHEGTSKAGKDYCFATIDVLHGKSIYALIAYKGLNDGGYHQYECVGFCDEKGFSAFDLANHSKQRCVEYQQFLDSLNQQVKQSQPAPAVAPAQQNYGYGQQVNSSYYQQANQQVSQQASQQNKSKIDDDLPF